MLFLLVVLTCGLATAQQPLLRKPQDPAYAKFEPLVAPKAKGLLLKKGDRLAICGDSITEQKMYSRLIETYLTVCTPELKVTTRQYGWSGEVAEGFLKRMTNDCLRFKLGDNGDLSADLLKFFSGDALPEYQPVLTIFYQP